MTLNNVNTFIIHLAISMTPKVKCTPMGKNPTNNDNNDPWHKPYLWLNFKERWWHHVIVEVCSKYARRRPLFKIKDTGPMLLQPGNTVPVRNILNRSWIPSTHDQRDNLLHPSRTWMKDTRGFLESVVTLMTCTEHNIFSCYFPAFPKLCDEKSTVQS